MIDLAPHIEYLLTGHDCVVVPGLGAFLVHETPAYYDAAAGRFMPPSRSLGFNQAITINDGLLVESVARRRGVSLDAARIDVEIAVSSFRHQLITSSALPVGNLGLLAEKDDTLVFEPSKESAVSMRYAGLAPLDVKPLAVETPEEVERVIMEPEREVSLPISLKIAASVIILLVMCGVFFTANNLIGKSQASYASLDSGLRTRLEYPAVPADSRELAVSRSIVLNIAMPGKDAVATVEPAHEPAQRQIENAKPAADRYLLVVGSFPSKKSALKHIGNDSRMAVAEMDGKYRVYAASAVTNEEAHAKADALRAEFPSVWICRR